MVNVTFTPNGQKNNNAANTVKILSPNTVKQGDTENDFRVQLLKGDVPVDLTGKTVTWSAASNKGKFVTDRPATVEGDGTVGIEFTGDDQGAVGSLRVEFKVTYADGDVEKFPAQNYAYFEITRSLDDLGHTPVMYASVQFFEDKVLEVKAGQETFEQTVDGKIVELESTVQQGIGAFTEDTEVVMARGGEVNLGARLDKTNAQLADTVGAGRKAEMEDLADEVISAITGSATVNVLSIPQDGSVTPEKVQYLDVLNQNLHNPATTTTGQYLTSSGGVATNAGYKLTDYIPVKSGKTYTNEQTLSSAYYDANKVLVSMIPLATSKTFTVPTGVSYVRMSYTVSATGHLSEGSTLFNVPYGTKQIDFNDPYIRSGISRAIAGTKGKKALIFGDSVTETHTVSEDGAVFTFKKTNWPTVAMNELGITNFYNFGKDGAAYRDRNEISASLTYYQYISNQITTAIATVTNPDIVIIAAGTNDNNNFLGDYATAMGKTALANLDRSLLFEAIRWAFWRLREAYPNAKFFVGMPIQRASYDILAEDTPTKFVGAIRRMAEYYNFTIIEAAKESGIVKDFELSGSPGRFLSDGLHPNTTGKDVLGKFYANQVKTNLL